MIKDNYSTDISCSCIKTRNKNAPSESISIHCVLDGGSMYLNDAELCETKEMTTIAHDKQQYYSAVVHYKQYSLLKKGDDFRIITVNKEELSCQNFM